MRAKNTPTSSRRFSITPWLSCSLRVQFAAAAVLVLGGNLIGQELPRTEVPSEASETTSIPKDASDHDSLGIAVEGAILKTIETTTVSSQVTGVIQNLNVKEGSRVQQGEEIARIRDVAVRLQLERSKRAVEIAKRKQDSDIDEQIAVKSQAVASNEYQWAIEANSRVSNVYPPKEVDRLKLILDRSNLEIQRAVYQRELAELETAQAEMEVKQNQELLLRHHVTAPCAGMVVAVEKRVGEWTEPGTSIVKIVEIDRLRVEGFLNTADADPQWIGTKAIIRVEVAGATYEKEGELVFISPDANPVNGQVRVFVEVENEDQKLRPGLRPVVYLKGTR